MHIIGTGRCPCFAAMSGLELLDRVALVSVNEQAITAGFINRNILEVDFSKRQTVLQEAQ